MPVYLWIPSLALLDPLFFLRHHFPRLPSLTNPQQQQRRRQPQLRSRRQLRRYRLQLPRGLQQLLQHLRHIYNDITYDNATLSFALSLPSLSKAHFLSPFHKNCNHNLQATPRHAGKSCFSLPAQYFIWEFFPRYNA